MDFLYATAWIPPRRFVAILLVVIGGLAATSSVAMAGPTSVAMRIFALGHPSPQVEVRAANLDGQPFFGATAVFHSLSCPGNYRLISEEEDQETGAISTFRARLSVRDFQSPALICTQGLPDQIASGVLSLRGPKAELIDLQIHRQGSGPFTGKLRITGLPRCGVAYVLEGQFGSEGSDGSFRSHFHVAQSLMIEGQRREPGPGC